MHMRLEKRVTLKDIAREAGCSAAVVSTVLNGAKGNTLASEETHARIIDIAKKLEYHPNFSSRSLKTSRSRTLGIYVQNVPGCQLGNSYEMQIFRGIEQAARKSQYDLLLINLSSEGVPEACAVKISERRIDGVLLLHADVNAPWIDALLRVTSNVVAIDFNRPKAGLDMMMFDNIAAVRLAVEHLAVLGHRRIGFIGSCLEHPEFDSVLRVKSFRDAVKEYELDDDERLVFSAVYCPRQLTKEDDYCGLEGYYGAEHFLSMGDAAPTAIIGYNDLVAIALMKRLIHERINIPDSVSVIGIDDSEYCLYMDPALTTIRHPLVQMGYEGTLQLIERIEGSITGPEVCRRFSPELVLRESTAAVSRGCQ